MSTNYTGNPTATQAPSPIPGAQAFPIAVLPADGDADNAASVAQAFKVLADNIAFLTLPRSAGGQVPIMPYKNALLQTRFFVDAFGFPNGQIQQFCEMWDDVNLTLKTVAANGPWSGRWNYSIFDANSGPILVNAPSTLAGSAGQNGFSRSVMLATNATSATNCAAVQSSPLIVNRSDHSVNIGWDFMPDTTPGFVPRVVR